VVNILGKVTTITARRCRPSRIRSEVEQPSELLEKSLDHQSVYWKALPLMPGLYRLDIVIKDVNNPDHVGIYGRALNVPTYHDEKLGTSTADSGRPDEFCELPLHRQRQFCHREYLHPGPA